MPARLDVYILNPQLIGAGLQLFYVANFRLSYQFDTVNSGMINLDKTPFFCDSKIAAITTNVVNSFQRFKFKFIKYNLTS